MTESWDMRAVLLYASYPLSGVFRCVLFVEVVPVEKAIETGK